LLIEGFHATGGQTGRPLFVSAGRCLNRKPHLGIIQDMAILILLPVFLSFILMAAHFLRWGNWWIVGLCLAAPLLLILRRWWTARLVQVLLILGALEWLRTMYVIMEIRMALGAPWERMAMIIGGVALFTVLSGGVFLTGRLRRIYGLRREPADFEVLPAAGAPQ
jgi:hypothetical protein